jgi:hypothetical protein
MTVAAYIQGGLIYREGLSGGKYGNAFNPVELLYQLNHQTSTVYSYAGMFWY